MIGLGTDIIEIERIRRAIQRERFVSHTFTPQEQAWLETKAKNKAESAAGLFCAKEAVAKALGTGFQRGLNLKDIEITHDALGAPNPCLPSTRYPAGTSWPATGSTRSTDPPLVHHVRQRAC